MPIYTRFLVFRKEVLEHIQGVDPSFMQELTDDLLLVAKESFALLKKEFWKNSLKLLILFFDKETGIIKRIR